MTAAMLNGGAVVATAAFAAVVAAGRKPSRILGVSVAVMASILVSVAAAVLTNYFAEFAGRYSFTSSA